MRGSGFRLQRRGNRTLTRSRSACHMGGAGLEPATPSLSRRLDRSRPFAKVRLSLQNGAFSLVTFSTSAPERTMRAAIAAAKLRHRYGWARRRRPIVRQHPPGSKTRGEGDRTRPHAGSSARAESERSTRSRPAAPRCGSARWEGRRRRRSTRGRRCRRGRRQAAHWLLRPRRRSGQELVVRRLRKPRPTRSNCRGYRSSAGWRSSTVEPSARERSTKAPENSVWFSISIVNMPAVGDVSPSYVQPSLVSVARIAASSPPQAMGTRDTAALSSATAMRVLDATRRAYRRGPASRNLESGAEARARAARGYSGNDGTRTRDLRRDSWAAGVAVDRVR